MPIVQNIDGIPAYTTIQEALNWGSQYGIITYHTHLIAGEVAYMAGSTHDEITSAIRSGNTGGSVSSGGSSSGGGY